MILNICNKFLIRLIFNYRRKTKNPDTTPHESWSRFVKYLLTFMIRKYPYLHKMDNVCIDLKQKQIQYVNNQKFVPILTTHTGKFSVYMLNDETMEHFKTIIKNKCNEKANTSKCMKSMIEHKFLESNAKFERQSQELKELKELIEKSFLTQL